MLPLLPKVVLWWARLLKPNALAYYSRKSIYDIVHRATHTHWLICLFPVLKIGRGAEDVSKTPSGVHPIKIFTRGACTIKLFTAVIYGLL